MSDKSTWRRQQNKDIYFRKAIDEGWRSRAVYKLKQINEKSQILKNGMTCIDLGSSPGSWSQFVSREMSGDVQVFAVDLIPMDRIQSVNFMQGDFTDEKFYLKLLETIKNREIDLVMSDMAPNISGIKVSDQAKSIYLAELARSIAIDTLKKEKGNFLCKLFQGQGVDQFVKETRQQFEKVNLFKPRASRKESSEIFLIAKHFHGQSV
tara:strand:- start:487 stop:1110 length:624 start_codon:yes stop_codon:yes gene_type:complete